MTEPQPAQERATLRGHLDHPPQIEVELDARTLILTSAWGLFSSKGIDEGTALLLKELAALAPQSRVLDLGCGYGAIGLVLAALWPDAEVVLLDKDLLAVETARGNIDRNGLTNARAVLSSGFRDAPPGPYDLIASNLPAQAGNEATDELFLDAYENLGPGGTLVVVTVVGMKRYVRRRLLALFGNHHKAKQGPRHIVAEATRSLDGP